MMLLRILTLVSQLISLPEAQVEAPEGAVPVIDLVHLGKFKLVSGIPFTLEIRTPGNTTRIRSTR